MVLPAARSVASVSRSWDSVRIGAFIWSDRLRGRTGATPRTPRRARGHNWIARLRARVAWTARLQVRAARFARLRARVAREGALYKFGPALCAGVQVRCGRE